MQDNRINSDTDESKAKSSDANSKVKKARGAQGQIVKKGKDKFLIRVYIGCDSQGHRHYYSETIKGSIKDAKKRLTEKLREKDTGTLIKTERITLNEYLDKWLESAVSVRVRPNTLFDYKKHLRLHVKPYLGHYRLDALRPLHIQGLNTKLQQRGLSISTIKKAHVILFSALNQAVKWRMLSFNPAVGAEVSRGDRNASQNAQRQMRTLTLEQASHFLATLSGDAYYALFLLALIGGLRPEEYLGLRWRDCQLANGVIAIRTVLIRRMDGKGWYFGEPKTKRSRRSVPLPASLITALIAHKKRQDEWKQKAGLSYTDYDLVFTTKSGLPIDRRNLRESFQRRLKAAGLPSTIRLYDLRHSCASLLLMANEHPKVVSERLGHNSVAITLDVYSHVLPTMQQAASDKLEQMLITRTPDAHQ